MSRKNIHDDIEKFHEVGIYVPTRTLYMGSEEYDLEHGESGCDGAMAARAVKNLHVLDTVSDAPITILMNNVGGSEYDCFAIIDAIRACRSEVVIRVFGHAMSAGSLILQAADRRIMAPNSRQMIHYGTWACNDHSKTFQRWAKEGQKIDDWMELYYLERIREKLPNFKLSRLRSMLDHDTFLTAEESVKLGLADAVMDDTHGNP